MAEYDQLYGPCQDPPYKNKFEHHQPRSWLRLVGDDADRFRAYVDEAGRGGYLAAEFFESFTTLWLVDEDGEVIVAVEEGVDREIAGGVETYPLPRMGPRPGEKLGHPALVGGGAARIGGELHVQGGNPTVYIDNKSGRFGAGRTRENLEAAADLFRKLGFNVSPRYMPPRVA